jgi:hypothetical protein
VPPTRKKRLKQKKQNMKTLTKLTLAVTMLLASMTLCNAQGYHYVRPYTDRNGNYHQPHYQTNPDGIRSNNWSYPGNVNPFTGRQAPLHTMPRSNGLSVDPNDGLDLD